MNEDNFKKTANVVLNLYLATIVVGSVRAAITGRKAGKSKAQNDLRQTQLKFFSFNQPVLMIVCKNATVKLNVDRYIKRKIKQLVNIDNEKLETAMVVNRGTVIMYANTFAAVRTGVNKNVVRMFDTWDIPPQHSCSDPWCFPYNPGLGSIIDIPLYHRKTPPKTNPLDITIPLFPWWTGVLINRLSKVYERIVSTSVSTLA